MKIISFILILIVLPTIVGAQRITKSTELYSKNYNTINVYKTYEADSLVAVNIVWRAQDSDYKHIINMFTVFSGDPSELLEIVNSMIDFYNKYDPDVSTTLGDIFISNTKMVGMKLLYVSVNQQSNVYTSKYLSQIKLAVSNFVFTDTEYSLFKRSN